MRFLARFWLAALLLIPSGIFARQLALTVENDSFTWTGRDVHYTSGVLFSVSYPATANTWVQKGFNFIKGDSFFGETVATNWAIGHQIFTPEIISIASPQPTERPWASFMFGKINHLWQTDLRFDQLSLVLGVVGPHSLGEDIQTKLHSYIGFHYPEGWRNQLHNELAGYVAWQRSWPHFWKHYTETHTFSAGPYVGTALGTVYRYGSVGVMARYAPVRQGVVPLPQRVSPSHPTLFGIPSMSRASKVRQWSWFGSAECRAVEHNLFLDGNTTQDSPSIEKEPLVFDLSLGFTTIKKEKQWTYTFVYRTKEFKGQNTDDIFASISVSFL